MCICTNQSYRTLEWARSNVRISHDARSNTSRHTYEWVMLHLWMSHGAHVNESYCMCKRVTFRKYTISHVSHIHWSCHTEFVSCHTWRATTPVQGSRIESRLAILHIRMSHASRTNKSRHKRAYKHGSRRVKLHIRMSHVLVLGNSRHKQGSQFVVCCCTGDWFHWKCYTPETTKSRNFKCMVRIQIKPKSQFEFVLRDTEESEFLDLVDFGDVALSVESVIWMGHVSRINQSRHQHECVIRRNGHVARMNESRLIYGCIMSLVWIGHVTQTSWAAARDVSRHKEWARRHRHVHRQGVTCEWVMWHVREILHASYHTNEQTVMSHSYRDWFYRMIPDFRMISDVYGNGVTCEWVTSHVRKMLHATRMEKVSCHTHIVTVEWIVTLTVKVSCVNTSCHTYRKKHLGSLSVCA